jgi:hypothetical protein
MRDRWGEQRRDPVRCARRPAPDSRALNDTPGPYLAMAGATSG